MSSGLRGYVRAISAVSDTTDTLTSVLFGDMGKGRGGPGVNMGGNSNPPKSLIGHLALSN